MEYPSDGEAEEASPSNSRKKFMPKIALDLPKDFAADLNGSNGGSRGNNDDLNRAAADRLVSSKLQGGSKSRQSFGAANLSSMVEADEEDFSSDTANECNECGKGFSKARSLQIHMEAVHLRTNFQKCPYCSKECSQVVHMVRHIKCVHYKVRHFQCLHCESASYQKNDVVRHLQSKHKYTGHNVDSQYSEIPKKVILYDCPDCYFKYVDCETLLSHSMNEHFDAEQYVANSAGGSTSTPMQTTSNVTLKPCDSSQIGGARSSPRTIKNPHIPNVEITPVTSTKPRTEALQKGAATGPRPILPRPIANINTQPESPDKNEGDNKYFCNTCGKGFAKIRSLQIHVEAVHLRTNFQRCPYCQKECSQAGHMVRHIKCVHYKIRHFQCNLCEVASYQKNEIGGQ